MSYLYLPQVKRRARSSRFPWVLFLFVSLSLFVIFHWPLVLHTTVDDYNVSEEIVIAGLKGSGTRQGMLIALCVVALVSLFSRRADPKLRIGGAMGWVLLGFLAWAIMSTMWAQDLSLTLKRLTSFVIICVFATAVARRLTLREVVLWTFFTTALFFVVAISAEILSGMFQPGTYGYRFSGIQHPNGEGVECALLALSGLVAGSLEKRRKWLFVSCGLVGTIFLALTASRTTLAGAALAFTVYAVMVSQQKTRAKILPLAGIVASLVLLLAVAGTFRGLQQKLFPGRDEGGGAESFAGRTSVWADLIPYIKDRPIQGYGYGGFWTPAIQNVIAYKEGWEVPDGHSTYVDYVLTLGAVGITLNGLCLATGLGRAYSFFRRTRDPYFAFLAAILVFCVVDGFLESAAGEVSPLACLTIIALIRLAFVPLGQTAASATETALWKRSSTRRESYTFVPSP
jgi:exopolysaccharide production protein ExoQ